MQDQVPLGRKVVVQAAETEVSRLGGLPHAEPSCAVPVDQPRDGEEDLVLPREAILPRTTGFPDMRASFCGQLATPLPTITPSCQRIYGTQIGH
jgi:hypothetical protein